MSNDNVSQGTGDQQVVDTSETFFQAGSGGRTNTNMANFVRSFSGSRDPDEVNRFLDCFVNISHEARWTETFSRMIFENKLEGEARSTYFVGLGKNSVLSMKDRIEAFRALFTHPRRLDELEESFFKCRQNINESVISYRFRLEALAQPLAIQHGGADVDSFKRMINKQFVKGLKDELKFEVLKGESADFAANVDLAVKMEKCMVDMGKGHTKLNASQSASVLSGSASEELAKAMAEIALLKGQEALLTPKQVINGK